MFVRREERRKKQRKGSSWYIFLLQRSVLITLLSGLCVLSLVACTENAPQEKATPTATFQKATPEPQVLFEADWTKGLKAWQVVGGWKVKEGYIESDLGSGLALTLPYQLTMEDYAIEFRLQIVSVPKNGGGFQVVADRQAEKNGYTADILNLLAPGYHGFATHPLSEVLLDPEDAMQADAQVRDYEPSDLWRLYRVEVKGPRVNFFIGENRVSSAISSQTTHLSNGPIHFFSHAAILRVSSFLVLSN